MSKESGPSDNLLVVLGMHRSGTSAVCAIVNSCGYDFGADLISSAADNPKGFWEDRGLVDLDDRLLGGADNWKRLTPPDGFDERLANAAVQWYAQIRGRVSGRLAFKDPRLCRLMEFWLGVVDRPKVLLVVRRPEAVVASLRRRNGIHPGHGLALWITYNFEAVRAVVEHGLPCRVVDYDRLVGDSASEAAVIREFLGAAAVDAAAVDAALCHNWEAGGVEGAPWFLSESARELYRLILSGELDAIAAFAKHYDRLLRTYAFVDEMIDACRSEYAERGAYQTHLENDLASLKEALKDQQERNVALTAAKCAVEAERDAIEAEKDTVEAERDTIEAERDTIEAERDTIEAERDAIEKVRWEVDEQLLAVYRSRSWRLTRPLRVSASWARAGYRSSVGRLSWAVLGVGRRVAERLKGIGYSAQSPKALDAMVDKRPTVDIEALSRRPEEEVVNEWPEITISVVTYNNGSWLELFLSSLLTQDYPLDRIHLIFVDNASTDATPEVLHAAASRHGDRFARFTVEGRPNRGFGASHDFAIRGTTTELVLVSNIDLEFLPNSITRVVAAALRDGNAASWELRQAPYEHPKFVDPVSLCVNWSSHACILLDRRAYLEVGGYEKQIFMYGEDVELSYRLRRAGHRLRYVPSAVIKHYTYQEAGEVKPVQFRGSVLANYFIRLRYGTPRDVLSGFLLLAVLLVRGAGFKGSRRMLFRALPPALAKTPFFLATRKRSSAYFPFYNFAYDLVRDGAFHEVDPQFAGDPKDEPPLITVVTRTVAGHQALLRQCMISVINQTYPNIEHLIVEDGGDSAAKLVEEIGRLAGAGYAARHIACEKRGRAHAGNLGMAAAAGRHIVLLDDDDLFFPDHIEVLQRAVTKNNVDAAYTLAWDIPTRYLDKEQGRYREFGHATPPLFFQSFDRGVLRHHNYLPIQSVLFAKEMFERCGGFEEDMSYLEDWVLWKKYAHNSEFIFVPKTTSLYRTPADLGAMMARKKLLDRAYEDALHRPIFQCDDQ